VAFCHSTSWPKYFRINLKKLGKLARITFLRRIKELKGIRKEGWRLPLPGCFGTAGRGGAIRHSPPSDNKLVHPIAVRQPILDMRIQMESPIRYAVPYAYAVPLTSRIRYYDPASDMPVPQPIWTSPFKMHSAIPYLIHGLDIQSTIRF